MPSIHDVAHRAKVSIGTVSRVLNDSPNVTASTRRLVKKAIAELNYRPNPSARALRSNRTHLIALTIPELTNPYFAAIAEGVQHILAPANFQLILCKIGLDDDIQTEHIAMLLNKQVDGLIVVARRFTPLGLNLEGLLEIGKKGYPLVLLGQQAYSTHFDMITTETSGGMREAMLHLLDAGHTEIAYFGAPPGIGTARLDAYRAALAERGVFFNESLIFAMDPILENGYKFAENLLKMQRRPTAIMAVNDIVAVGAMMALQQFGVSVPEEISVIGFDDIPLASIVHPKLTTVFQPKYELGRLAAERLLGRLDKTITQFEGITLSSHLVVRDSTARARPSRRR